MVTIELKGREIAPLDRATRIICGRDPEDEDKTIYGSVEQIDAVAKAIMILGNSGLEDAGETADLTYKGIMKALKPMQMPGAVNKIMDAMAEGMLSEIPEKDDGPVDVVLEEINRKKEKTS
jgi:NAD(P)H-dependent FMN reductase